jgi:hypothetical protein
MRAARWMKAPPQFLFRTTAGGSWMAFRLQSERYLKSLRQ